MDQVITVEVFVSFCKLYIQLSVFVHAHARVCVCVGAFVRVYRAQMPHSSAAGVAGV